MNPVALVAPAARRDLDEYADWLGTEADIDVAERFAEAAATTFIKLAAAPGIGSPVEFDRKIWRDLRKWRVDGFPRLLIFYAPVPDGVRIVRVIHGAQDWMTMLDMS